MTGFSVNLWILHAGAAVWEEQADNLQAARKRLVAAGSQSATLGDRVGPIAKAYFETWRAEAGSQARAAQGHANALSEIGTSYVVLDQQAADDLNAALPWGQASAIQESLLVNIPGWTPPGSALSLPDPSPNVPQQPGTQP